MVTHNLSPLTMIEPRLRSLLPADLYALAWIDPTAPTLNRVFEHLRTLQRILYGYVPRQVVETLPRPGESRYRWQNSALMFTDLAGFTKLMEANAKQGREGAEALLKVLNSYFAEMIEIISKSGGDLLEFTGDAMLVQFQADRRHSDVAQTVRAGLRMQRAMARFANIETAQGTLSLAMRVGIHAGRFLTADIGTPCRIEHVLLGKAVQQTKHAEGAGQAGRVCLTEAVYEQVKDEFRFEPGKPGYVLVVDDISTDQLGEYDITPSLRRLATPVLLDRSAEGLLYEIEQLVERIEPLASYQPAPILNVLVESTTRRQIRPNFVQPTIVFVNLIGLPEAVDRAAPGDEVDDLVSSFSRIFALINATVVVHGGVLRKVTYHLVGSDIMICFGVPSAYTDEPVRAAQAASAIRDIITNFDPPVIQGEKVKLTCQIGIARGSAFAAEIGEPRGRREFNVLGDTVNTAARLMGRAATNQILMTEPVYQQVKDHFNCDVLEPVSLKGKAAPTPIFALNDALD